MAVIDNDIFVDQLYKTTNIMDVITSSIILDLPDIFANESVILMPQIAFQIRKRAFQDMWIYHQISNIRHTLVANKFADHSDVIGALPAGAAPTTSSFSN